jgi:hypothetical protein
MPNLTIRELDAMSAEEYAKRLRGDPNFRAQVEALEAQRRQAAIKRGTLDSLGTPGNQ